MTLVYARIADRVVADEYESVCQQIDALYNTAATPASASETPSITPSADAGAPRLEVSRLGRSDVGISCPGVGEQARRADAGNTVAEPTSKHIGRLGSRHRCIVRAGDDLPRPAPHGRRRRHEGATRRGHFHLREPDSVMLAAR
jgi:hypothetical protein